MDKLHFVKQKFNELGYRIEAILCFREPVSYADCLYCELLKYGLDVSFNDFIDEIIENGRPEVAGSIPVGPPLFKIPYLKISTFN